MQTRLALILSVLLLSTGWTIRDLGTLPGGGLSSGHAINNKGVVAGMAGNSAGVMRAVWWDAAGTIHEIPTPVVPGRFSSSHGINDKGAIVGRMGTPTSDWHAFKYQFGVLTYLGADSASIAFAINNSNDIVGQWTVAGTPPKHYAVAWGGGTPGSVFWLGGFGGFIDFASDIADAPVVTGTSALSASPRYRHAFLWISGSLRDLGTLGGYNSYGRSVTVGTWPDPSEASIFVVGESEFLTGITDTHAFLYNMGTMTDLGTLPGCTQTQAYAINKNKHIVGACHGGGDSHAWLWDGTGAMINLESLLPPGTGWEKLQAAYDINNNGQITGYGLYKGEGRAFVMTP
jgi:probable HAF family extracellular repeat protein